MPLRASVSALIAALALAIVVPLHAQSGNAAWWGTLSPGACRDSVRAARRAESSAIYRATHATASKAQKARIDSVAVARAQRCIARAMRMTSAMSVRELVDLGELQLDARSDSLARQTFRAAITRAVTDDDQIIAHRGLAQSAFLADDYDVLFPEARAVTVVGERLTPERRMALAEPLLISYSNLAYAYANKGHPDSARAIIKRAREQLAGFPQLDAWLSADERRYALIGTRAPELVGAYWLNRADGANNALPAPGRVTVIEFTAYWCGPCRASYPTLSEMSSRFGGRGLDVVLAVAIEGAYDGRELAEQDWVAANKQYFVTEHGLDVPIAFERRELPAKKGNWSAYAVMGIPQVVIVDRAGIVRDVITGWDSGSAEVVERKVKQLLVQESAAGR